MRYDIERQAAAAKAEKRRQEVRAWRAAGLTWAQIAKLLGVTRARAHQIGSKAAAHR
jgi:hypothetical protein